MISSQEFKIICRMIKELETRLDDRLDGFGDFAKDPVANADMLKNNKVDLPQDTQDNKHRRPNSPSSRRKAPRRRNSRHSPTHRQLQRRPDTPPSTKAKSTGRTSKENGASTATSWKNRETSVRCSTTASQGSSPSPRHS